VGYLGAYVATAHTSGRISGIVGDAFSAGRLGNYTITQAPDGGTEVLLGPPFKFDKANINDWKSVY
jgi:rhamnose transport system substrate-binding protein